MSLLTASTARETLWASDATAELLDDLQFALGEGACMEAAATAVWVPETALTVVDVPIRHLRAPGMIRRWRCG